MYTHHESQHWRLTLDPCSETRISSVILHQAKLLVTCIFVDLHCLREPSQKTYLTHVYYIDSIYIYIWRARCKNGLNDDFGPAFTKPPNYLLSCNVTVAKWIVSCSQHIVLVIWIEFPPQLYQVTLLLARKVKLPKCQEIPYNLCWG